MSKLYPPSSEECGFLMPHYYWLFLALFVMFALIVVHKRSQVPPPPPTPVYKMQCGPLGNYTSHTKPAINDGYMHFVTTDNQYYVVARDRCIIRYPR